MWHASGTAGDGDLGLGLVVMASGVTASAPERRPLHYQVLGEILLPAEVILLRRVRAPTVSHGP
jgi:hypothetical protein